METFLAPWRPQLLSILRIMAGLMLTAHGTAKLLGWPIHPPMNNVRFGIAELVRSFFRTHSRAAARNWAVNASGCFHPLGPLRGRLLLRARAA